MEHTPILTQGSAFCFLRYATYIEHNGPRAARVSAQAQETKVAPSPKRPGLGFVSERDVFP